MAEAARSERTGGDDGGDEGERMAACTREKKVEALEEEDETAEQKGMSEHGALTIEDPSAGKGSIKKRLGRQWHKYCQTLPRHYKGGLMSSDEVDAKRAGQNVERRRPEKGDHHKDSHRRAGLPEHQRCSFWIEQKKRLCSRPRMERSSFCIGHQVAQGADGKEDSSEARECEFCRTRILPDRYESHLKRCNVRTREDAMRSCPYYKQDINSGSQGRPLPSSQPVMSDAEDPVGFVGRVNENYEIHVRAIEEQDSSLISNMEDKGLLNHVTDSTFIEFGAGKAMLSLSLVQCDEAVNLLLVEKDSGHMKGKADRILRLRSRGAFQRLTVDIRHLDLRAVPCGEIPLMSSVVGISKHLCGVATDLALRCLVNYHHSGGPGENQGPNAVKGICIALCCHHLCTWDDYVGKKFFVNDLQIGRGGFEMMCKYASWATGCRQHMNEKQKTGDNNVEQQDSSQHHHNAKITMSREEKVLLYI
ncbi:hypothetical protein GUITHDRAFT_110392 [Guillardia theta CCMP2712]|uniref:tRNA:m(4)X modification enzyme TRM13 n=1 Tax=Guillardia theta (strain CCMP2712) TaxID=905079 RepID=L1J5G3_GUITC|nr:hypothetical protein GUITHDRAFT_110392 [Guillardia theta CCMP2712]EKX43587.1 hypothetical protein GUITHDRAFT_110392 [Guillardia theta CCMP2712]|eukprot:XP_005830567.1 hypothetical protein GUITHDRAFT_110392 [Guillardia theta CCMP2712]